jgi:hypothetical protein
MGFSYNVNVLNQKGSPAIYTDTFANRPAAGFVGRLFIANDTSAIYEDIGTAWVLIANVSSGAGTLQQVTTNGNTSNVGISVTAGGISSNTLTGAISPPINAIISPFHINFLFVRHFGKGPNLRRF